MGSVFVRRQEFLEAHSPHDAWWYSRTALAVRWAILGGIFIIVIVWFVGGYYHAQRRIKQGLPPLAYHRWLLPRSQRKRSVSSLQNQFSFYREQEISGNDIRLYSPKVYDHNKAPPPTYQPPQGASKVNPVQDYNMPRLGPSPQRSLLKARQPNEVLESPPPTARSSRSTWAGGPDPFIR